MYKGACGKEETTKRAERNHYGRPDKRRKRRKTNKGRASRDSSAADSGPAARSPGDETRKSNSESKTSRGARNILGITEQADSLINR